MRRRGTACGYSAQCHVISHRTANIRRPPSGRRTPRGCPVSCSDRATVALSALSPSFCLFTVAHDSGRILCLGRIILRAGPFVKRFALCYGTVVWLSCPVCDVGVLWPNGWKDQAETWQAGRSRSWPRGVRWDPTLVLQRGIAPNFRPISVLAKWLDGSRC